MLALENTCLAPDEQSLKKLDMQRYFAVARFETGDLEGGNRILGEMESALKEEREKRNKAVSAAEKKARDGGKKDKEIEAAKKAAEKNFTKKIGDIEAKVNELSVYAALTKSSPDRKRAAELLAKLRNVGKARHARLWERAGNQEKAVALAGEAVSAGKNQVYPLATQVEILYRAGKKEEAKTAFTSLRTVACDADRDLPVLKRLSAIAAEFGFPEPWQVISDLPEGCRPRPDLDSLGPFRWSPSRAPDFTLPDVAGKGYGPFDSKARATLLIFYLGKGCSHCMEQLNEFAPAVDKFDKAGIRILAVSSDTPEGLAETFADTAGDESGEGRSPFPFPLLSDAGLKVFKEYRAFDDFENQPLHGTFLIDEEQRIRWQDISFEPFMYSDWLLEECVRLLGQNG